MRRLLRMYFIIYLSTAVDLFLDEELVDLLKVSRGNNQKKDISGMLLYNNGGFLQVLEGEQDSVSTLFHKLQNDNRHFGVLKVMDGNVDRRYFQDWSMGFRKLTDKEWKDTNGLLTVGGTNMKFENAEGTSNEMLTFIRSFCQANYK